MAETATAIIDTILRRVRDTNGTAHSRAFVLSRLSELQRVANTGLRIVTDTASLSTTSYQPFYQISTGVASGNAVRILGVIEGNRNLDQIPWRTLKQIDTNWLRRTSERFELFSLIGREQLIIWPTKKQASSVTVVYAKLTNTLSTESTATEMPDDEMPFVMDITTALLLAKTRYLKGFVPVMERIGKRIENLGRRDLAA